MGGTRSTGDGPRPGSPTVAVAALPGFPARPPACAARARRPRRGGGSSVTQGSASPRVTVPRGGLGVQAAQGFRLCCFTHASPLPGQGGTRPLVVTGTSPGPL